MHTFRNLALAAPLIVLAHAPVAAHPGAHGGLQGTQLTWHVIVQHLPAMLGVLAVAAGLVACRLLLARARRKN